MSSEPKHEAGDPVAPGDGEMHPPPSMWWFVIPLVLIAAYAVLTR
jgi:hypothetical protein